MKYYANVEYGQPYLYEIECEHKVNSFGPTATKVNVLINMFDDELEVGASLQDYLIFYCIEDAIEYIEDLLAADIEDIENQLIARQENSMTFYKLLRLFKESKINAKRITYSNATAIVRM